MSLKRLFDLLLAIFTALFLAVPALYWSDRGEAQEAIQNVKVPQHAGGSARGGHSFAD